MESEFRDILSMISDELVQLEWCDTWYRDPRKQQLFYDFALRWLRPMVDKNNPTLLDDEHQQHREEENEANPTRELSSKCHKMIRHVVEEFKCPCECLQQYPPGAVEKITTQFASFSQYQRHLVVKGILMSSYLAAGDSYRSTGRRKRRMVDKPGVKSRSSFEYLVFERKICRKAFTALTLSSTQVIKTISEELGEDYALERFENQQKICDQSFQGPKCPMTDEFMQRMITEAAYPVELDCSKTPILFPEVLKKKKLYTLLKNGQKVSWFYRYWFRYYNYIQVQRPGQVFCRDCIALQRDPTSESMALLISHRNVAKSERLVYQNQIESAIEAFEQNPEDPIQIHLSIECSIEFHIPSSFRLVSIANEARGEQMHYPWWSNCCEYTLPNVVISALHEYFNTTTKTRPKLNLHVSRKHLTMDLLKYLQWRCRREWNNEIQVSVMVLGHSRTYCDAGLAAIQAALAQSHENLYEAIESSGLQVCRKLDWYYDWETFLSRDFSSHVANLNELHSFQINASCIETRYFS